MPFSEEEPRAPGGLSSSPAFTQVTLSTAGCLAPALLSVLGLTLLLWLAWETVQFHLLGGRTEQGASTHRRASALSLHPCLLFQEAACGTGGGERHKHRLFGSQLSDYSPWHTHDLELSNVSFPTPATSLGQRGKPLNLCIQRTGRSDFGRKATSGNI